MFQVRRPLRLALVFAFAILCALPLFAVEKSRIRVDNYVIDAELIPQSHRLSATAKVTFMALDDITSAVFDLHNALRPSKVLDEKGKPLSIERNASDSTVRVLLPNGLNKGTSTTLTFVYEGTIETADDSPVEGLKLASIGPDTTYLLYAGRWFPVNNYGLNRFTATINITVPTGFKVIGSGATGSKDATAKGGAMRTTYSFAWDHPSFPGTIIAGQFLQKDANAGGLNVHVFLKPNHEQLEDAYAQTAVKEIEYFSAMYGAPPSRTLNVVELPNDTVPTAWAPEIAGLAGRYFSERTDYRTLADAIAHQWWGASVSPNSHDDFWLEDGFANYSQLRYVESVVGQTGAEEAVKDIATGALAYDTTPLAQVGTLDMFSPEFQSLNKDKGAMILHMLRWVVGDAAFDRTMKDFATQYAGKPATTADFQAVAEKDSGAQLTSFFTQWFDSTGAPEFHNRYTVFRLGNNKGFRVTGQISQDLDLFQMPIEVRVDTDGKSEMKRIEVAGTNSPYMIETFGKPRRIVLDPNDRVLKNSPDLKMRAAILRGQQLQATGDYAEALKQYQQALASNHDSSLAHFRIADIFFEQRNYQAAANEYRAAIDGDNEPRWTEVWSHIQLGKIFDVTGQRERAVNEYMKAQQTRDDTQGAQAEAAKYLQKPYTRPRSSAQSGD
jgi:peptidase M1-like protein/tetratricopeptide repeat protein